MPANDFISHPLTIKTVILTLSVMSLMLYRGYYAHVVKAIGLIDMIAAICSIIIAVCGWEKRIASWKFWQNFSFDSHIKWKHIQYSYDLIFVALNVGTLFSGLTMYSFFFIALALCFLLEAIQALTVPRPEDVEETRPHSEFSHFDNASKQEYMAV